jgi:Fibronectin type III domain
MSHPSPSIPIPAKGRGGPRAVRLFLLAGMMFFGVRGPARSAPLTTGADFLLMTTGARPDGMGQAFSAVADDVNTLSFNPAGLGNIRLPEVGYGYESFLGGIDYNFLGAALPMGGVGVLGLGYISMGTAPFNSTADPSAPEGTALDQAFQVGWGRSFYDLHLGASAKYIRRQLDGATGDGFAFDLGLRYRPLPVLTLAASAMNLGPGVRLSSWEPLPTQLNLGAAWTAVESPRHRLTLALNGAVNLATNTQSLGLGAEYWYAGDFALRTGYLARSRDDGFLASGFSAGAGVKFSFFELDYAFQPFDALGVVHRVSGLLRWEGPWAGDKEPNPPGFVAVARTPRGLEIRWEKPAGPASTYRVELTPLNGRGKILSPLVHQSPYLFRDFEPGTVYRVRVLTVNGANRSIPSPEVYAAAPEAQAGESPNPAPVPSGASVSRGVRGEMDDVGLGLSWDPVPGSEGYRVYRQSPSGEVFRVTQSPRKSNRVWVTDTSGLAGWKWIVTSLSEGGDSEKTLGSFLWYPGSGDQARMEQAPRMRLHAEIQEGHRVFLDWNGPDGAAGYSLFYATRDDGVLELYGDVPPGRTTLLLGIRRDETGIFFLLAPKAPGGGWTGKSNLVQAEFLTEDPGK